MLSVGCANSILAVSYLHAYPQATSRHSSITVEESFDGLSIPLGVGEENKKKEREKLWN